MKKLTLYFVAFFSLYSLNWTAHGAENNKLSFSPAPGVYTTITAEGPNATLTVKKGLYSTSEKILIETEKQLNLLSEDYNFDGYKDFSISHVDDGMGTYSIYQIYLYSPKEGEFVRAIPKCGEDFINIVLSRKNHTLTNSFFFDNQAKTCTAKY